MSHLAPRSNPDQNFQFILYFIPEPKAAQHKQYVHANYSSRVEGENHDQPNDQAQISGEARRDVRKPLQQPGQRNPHRHGPGLSSGKHICSGE